MSDENSGEQAARPTPSPAPGAFDWLRESHQQSVPLAPLAPTTPPPAPFLVEDAGSAGVSPGVVPAAPASAPVATPTAHPASYTNSASVWPLATTPRSAATPPAAPPFASPVGSAATAAPPPLMPPPPLAVPTRVESSEPVAAAPTWNPPTTSTGSPAPAYAGPPSMLSTDPGTAGPGLAGPGSADSGAEVPLIPRPSFMSHPPAEPSAPLAPQPPAAGVFPPARSAAAGAQEPAAFSDGAAAGPAAFPFAGLRPNTEDGTASPLPPTAFGGAGLQLERRPPARRSPNGPLDWAALVLAIVLAPIGLILGVVAAIVGSRSRGFVSSVAKAAITVGVVLTVVLGVGAVVLAKLGNEQANHDAIAASSAAWCTQLTANPATLASNTFGWPAPGNTIPASEKAIAGYVAFWKKLDGLAPAGIKGGTYQVESAAASIGKSVKSTQTLDDGANVSQMQSVVANSGIQSWVTEYCK